VIKASYAVKPLRIAAPALHSLARLASFVSLVIGVLALSGEGQQQKSYPVTLDSHRVIEISYSYRSLPLEQRAEAISERLRQVADDPTVPASVTLVASDAYIIDLMAGEHHLVSILPGDAVSAGVPAETLARQWAGALERAIQQYRGERSWSKRIERLFLTLVTLVGAIFLLFAIRNATSRLANMVAASIEKRIEGVRSPMMAVVPRHHLHGFVTSSFKALRLVLSIALIALVFQLLLFFFPQTRYIASYVLNSLLSSLYAFAVAAWNQTPAMAFLVVVLITTWYSLKTLRFFFQRLADGSVTIEGFRPAWAGTTHRLISILLLVLAILIAYPYIPGSQSPAFKGITLFLGLLVSLGSTGLVANIVSGIMLTYMDEFAVGDLIRVGDFVARVRRTSMLTTELSTRKNEIVTIPNSLILSREVTNLSSPGEEGLIINSTVGVGYDVPWRQVESMMKLAASRTSGISRNLEPFVYTMSLNQFDITHELNVYLDKDASYWDTVSELNRNVLDAFNEYGVQIMTPAYEGDPEASKIVPKSDWFAAPARAREQSERKLPDQRFRQAR
jgi:small-conductance mechanosensitive channel